MNKIIQIGEHTPDLAELNGLGAQEMRDLLPTPGGYRQWPNQSTYSDNALDASARGAIFAKDNAATTYLYAGDAAKLYSLSGTTWSDISKAGSPAYALGATENWEFAPWGEKVIAVCGVNTAATNNPQIITLGGSNFADLSGSPPQARHIATVRNFVVMGNTWDGTDGLMPNRVRWCGINDETTWTVSAATQADFNDIYEGGWVQKVVGGEYGIVFLEGGIHRMTYVGSPTIWQFDEVVPGRGTIAPQSVAQAENMVFFLAPDGFGVLENGATVRWIGRGKVDRTFLDVQDRADLHLMSAAIDQNSRRVFWSYTSDGAAPDAVLCYDYSADKWSVSEQEAWSLVKMDIAKLGVGSTTNNPGVGFFTDADKVASWSTSTATMRVTSQEYQLTPGQRSMVTGVRPLFPLSSGTPAYTINIGSRDYLTDAITWTSDTALNARDMATDRVNARYHSFRCNLNFTFQESLGFEVFFEPMGAR